MYVLENFINHCKKLLDLLRLKSISGKHYTYTYIILMSYTYAYRLDIILWGCSQAFVIENNLDEL